MRDYGSVFWWDFLKKKKKKNSNCELLGIFFSGSFFLSFYLFIILIMNVGVFYEFGGFGIFWWEFWRV